MVDIALIDHAITAHARWKNRLRDAIAGGSCDLTVQQAKDDRACDFGRWIHELSPTERTDARIQNLSALHARFHQEAARVLDLAIHHRKAEAEAAMASGSPFNRVSTDLVLALAEWKTEVNTHPG